MGTAFIQAGYGGFVDCRAFLDEVQKAKGFNQQVPQQDQFGQNVMSPGSQGSIKDVMAKINMGLKQRNQTVNFLFGRIQQDFMHNFANWEQFNQILNRDVVQLNPNELELLR